MKTKTKFEKVTLEVYMNEYSNCQTNKEIFGEMFQQFLEIKKQQFIDAYGENGIWKRPILNIDNSTDDFFADL